MQTERHTCRRTSMRSYSSMDLLLASPKTSLSQRVCSFSSAGFVVIISRNSTDRSFHSSSSDGFIRCKYVRMCNRAEIENRE